MAETKRMTSEQVVGYLLEGEGLDGLRESLSWVVQQAWKIARERIKAFPAVNDVTGDEALPDRREEG